MSNPIDTIYSSFSINENELSINQVRWLLSIAYGQLEDYCKSEKISLGISEEEYILEFDDNFKVYTYVDLNDYITKINAAVIASKTNPDQGLGYVLPPMVIPGTVASVAALSRTRFAGIASDAIGELGRQATEAAMSKADEMISNLAGGILGGGPNKKGRPAPPASGGGNRGETYGGTGSTQPIGSNFANYVHPTKKLDYNLGIPTTLRGTDPFDAQQNTARNVLSSCLTLKVIKFGFPSDEPNFAAFYTKIWVPQVRDYLQGEKRLNTNLARLITPERMKHYLTRIGESLQIYHFFTNTFNYNLLGDGMNTNAGLRFLREEMFSTTALQKLSLLKERLDGLPWPQTLDSEIAYHGLIYTQSDVPFSGHIMNVPPIILSNLHVPTGNNEVGVINALMPTIIQDTIDKLDFTDITVTTDREDMFKMIGAICNTTDFQNSQVSSVQIEPYTDSVFNTDFVNNSVSFSSIPNAATAANYDEVQSYFPRAGIDAYTPVSYYSYTNDVPGMLQATWTPLDYSGTNYLGYWQPKNVYSAFQIQSPLSVVSSTSNILFFVDSIPGFTLVDSLGNPAPRGGFVHANPMTQGCWTSNNFVEYPCFTKDATNTKYCNSVSLLKPYGSQLITNMSMQTNFFQRNQYFKQVMETEGWAIGKQSNSTKVSSSRRSNKRYGKSDMDEDKDK